MNTYSGCAMYATTLVGWTDIGFVYSVHKSRSRSAQLRERVQGLLWFARLTLMYIYRTPQPNVPTCSHTLPLRILGCRLVSLTFDSLLIHVLSIYLFVGPRHCRTLWLGATRWSAVAGPIWLVGGHRSRLVPVLAGHHTQELWPVLRERLCGHHVVCPAVPGLCPPPDEGAGVEGGRGCCCCCCTGGPGGTRGGYYGQGGVVDDSERGFFLYTYNHGTYT